MLSAASDSSGNAKVEVEAADGSVSRLEARNIVIATGSEPVTPRIFGYDGVNVLTSEDVLKLSALPKSFLIIGAE